MLDAAPVANRGHVPPNPATAPGAVLALPVPGALTLGFGRSDAPVAALPARGGFVEIIAMGSGRRVDQPKLLPESVRPPSTKPWSPLEFMAAVDAAGRGWTLVGHMRSPVQGEG